jgi:hypothetical protein
MPRAILKLGYRCNNRCTFCHALAHRGRPDLEAAEVLTRVRQARALGADMVLFSGGEPTLRRDLPALIRLARAEGLGAGLITNGRALAYRHLAERLVASGLTYAYVSLHGADLEAHDAVTGAPGSHSQAVEGLRHLLDFPQVEVTVNVVVVRDTLPWLKGVPALLGGKRPYRLKFSLVDPKGEAEARFDQVVPPLGEAAAAVLQALDEAARSLPPGSPPPGHDGFPHCLMGTHAAQADDLFTHDVAWMRESHEECFFPVDHGRRVHPAPCADCALRPGCPGVYQEYVTRRGADELRPVAFPSPAGTIPAAPGGTSNERKGTQE